MNPALWALLAVVVAVDVALLVDLTRREVKGLPKWAWAVIVVAVSFPLGAIAYVVAGRVPKGVSAAAPAVPDLPPPTMPATTVRLPAASVPDDRPAVVATAALSKDYGTTLALDAVDLRVPLGSTYGLIGPNGSGKTTLLSILAGLRRPTGGAVELGVPRRRIGVLVDTPHFEPWLTATEVVDLARSLTAPDAPAARVAEVLADVGLADAADRRVGGYSRGMLQRVGLAACLVGDPDVLLLDEPSSALDPAGRREVLDLVGRLARTKTVVLSTHILGDVQQVCDTVGVLDRGRLRFQGPMEALLALASSAFVVQVREPAGGVGEALAAAPWVESVQEQAPGRWRVVVNDTLAAERGVPALVAGAGAALMSFQPATDLETAFLELTA